MNHHEVIINLETKQIICEKISEKALNIKDVEKYLSLEPFGNGFEEINFYFENINIINKTPLSNGKYYKLLSSNNIEYLIFKSDLINKIDNHMNIIGKLSINEFKGLKTITVTIEDILGETYD